MLYLLSRDRDTDLTRLDKMRNTKSHLALEQVQIIERRGGDNLCVLYNVASDARSSVTGQSIIKKEDAKMTTTDVKRGYIKIDDIEVKKADIRLHIATVDKLGDQTAVIEAVSIAFGESKGLTVQQLDKAILIIEAESISAPGSGEKKQAWRHTARLMDNRVMAMENFVHIQSHEGIDEMTYAVMSDFIHELKQRQDDFVETAQQYPNPMVMRLLQTTMITDASTIDLTKPTNEAGLVTVQQAGWGDGNKVRRDQFSTRTNIVGTDKPINVVNGNEDNPSSLGDEYGSMRLMPNAGASKQGYWVKWKASVWDGVCSYKGEVEEEPEDDTIDAPEGEG